jgi:neopullulanase
MSRHDVVTGRGVWSKRVWKLAVVASLSAVAVGALATGCDSGATTNYQPPSLDGPDAKFDGAVVADAGPIVPITPDAAPIGPCLTTFQYRPPAGTLATSVAVAGEWQNFQAPGVALVGPDSSGAFKTQIELAPGLVGYKLIVNGKYELDGDAPLRKYLGGVENSAVRVRDCRVPVFTLASKQAARLTTGQGSFAADVAYDGKAGPLDAASLRVTLKHDEQPVGPVAFTRDGNGLIRFRSDKLADGKYTLVVEGKTVAGVAAEPLRLVFWVEPEAFDWRDALIYMTMNDRFADGDAANNPPGIAGVEARATYKGGDLRGIESAVSSGYLSGLGVRALWLSPVVTNPAGAYLADDNVRRVSGYHGYWPTKAREVDARLGGAAALKSLVRAAHAKGIRVLLDYVVNHVHEEHEYFKAHPDWFRTGCVCGTNNCDWTDKRLECLFAPYLPDVNWSVPAAADQFASDAVWWMDEFDVDGFRLDAVKHVEDSAVRAVVDALRPRFEVAGTRVFLTGETAMGWSDCGVDCNKSQYDTITRYMDRFGLDGQIDFVTHHAVPYRTFAYGEKGLIHADFWMKAAIAQYPKSAVMTQYIGSHDSSRFSTLATYRGQSGDRQQGVAGNKWDNIAGPSDAGGLARHRLAMSWLLGLPGAPLMYYGDEYGEYGSADPNNRAMHRRGGALSADEQATLEFVRRAGSARQELIALRRGDYRTVLAREDQLIYARQTVEGKVALVALNRSTTTQRIDTPLPASLALPPGTVLRDRMGGTDVVVSNTGISVELGPYASAILAP